MIGGEKVVNTPYCPMRQGYRPVSTPYRVGVQTDEALWASVNRMPSRASLSRFGILRSERSSGAASEVTRTDGSEPGVILKNAYSGAMIMLVDDVEPVSMSTPAVRLPALPRAKQHTPRRLDRMDRPPMKTHATGLAFLMAMLMAVDLYAAEPANPSPKSEAVESFFASQDPFVRQTVLPNIEKHRKSDCTLQFVDKAGAAVPNLRIAGRLKRHQFLFALPARESRRPRSAVRRRLERSIQLRRVAKRA